MHYFFRLINNLSRLQNNQKIVYFILLACLMLTNTILLFTEQMNVAARIAFITIPLGTQMLLLTIRKKPGRIFLILLPKCIIDAFQFVLIILYGGSIIAVDMFLNLVTTSAKESGELLGNLLPTILFLIITYGIAIYLSIISIKNSHTLKTKFRKKTYYISTSLLAIGFISLFLAKGFKGGFEIKYDLYPNNVLYNVDFAIKKYNKIINYPQSSKNFSFNATRKIDINSTTGNQREIYILILGETERAANYGKYGYKRNTTKPLDSISNLVCFRDVLSQSNTTHKIVPLIFSAADAQNYNLVYKSKSILSAFKEVGFKTYFITNQEYNKSFMSHYIKEADESVKLRDIDPNSLDHNLLPYFNKFIEQDTSKNLFFVIHLYGSHFNYYQRYSKKFKVFTPDKADYISTKTKTELVNSYDNSIVSTADLVSQIIKKTDQQNCKSVVLYLSDHGEDIIDDSRHRFLHASPIPTYYQLHIPFIIWFSKQYKQVNKEKYNNTYLNKDSAISNNSVFHSLLDFADINTQYFIPSLSVCSKELKEIEREYLTDHDGCSKIRELPLHKFDIEQFKKRNIKY